MRTATLLTLALPVFFVTSVFGQESTSSARPCDVAGAWEMIDIKVVYPDRVDRPQHRQRQLKILTPTHFAFGRQTDDGESVFAGGGRYAVNGNTYTEIIEFHSSAPLVGTKIDFDCRIEGDTWYHTGNIGNFRLEEVWRRIGSSQAELEDMSEADRLTRLERETGNISKVVRQIRERGNR